MCCANLSYRLRKYTTVLQKGRKREQKELVFSKVMNYLRAFFGSFLSVLVCECVCVFSNHLNSNSSSNSNEKLNKTKCEYENDNKRFSRCHSRRFAGTPFYLFFPPNSGNKTDVDVLVLVLVKQYQGKKNNKRPRKKIFNVVIKQGYMLLSFVDLAVSVVRLIPIQEI